MEATGGVLIAAHPRWLAAQWPDAQFAGSVLEDNSEPLQSSSMLVEIVLVAGSLCPANRLEVVGDSACEASAA